MTRAAVYTRLSDDRHGTGLAVQRQEQDCRRLADLRGWEVTRVYSDNDLSGHKKVKRPEYERLLADVKAGAVDAIVVYSVDRLTRRVVDLAHLLDTVAEHEVAVATVSGDLDTSTSAGRMVANILGSVAQAESERISERVVRKQDELAAKGLPSNGGHLRPYGYERDRLTVVEAEAAVIKDAAERILAGESLGAVVAHLNETGVPSSTGKPWTRTALRTILTGNRVAGLRKHRGMIVGEAAWPAILDRDTWERVASVLNERGAEASRRASNSRRWLLSGLAVCSVCGSGLAVAHHGRRADGTPALRYACRDRHVGRGLEVLDEYVVAAALGRLSDPRVTERREVNAADPSASRRLQALRDRRAATVALLSDPDAVLSPAEVNAQVKALDLNIREAESALAEAHGSDVLAVAGPLTREQWDALPLSRRRAVLAALFQPIRVEPSRVRGGRGAFDPPTLEPREG
jgi:site-specific DNA recombinase